jgi:hypothetical protein
VACPNGIVCTDGRVTRLTFDSRLKLTGSIDGPSLGVLTDLQFLSLNGFPLTTIPTQIGRLAALTQLNLFDAELTGTVPSQVGNLRNLTALIVHSNQLTGTLPALEMLTKLTELDTRGNVGLVGSMPALPRSLRQLNVQNCSFTALPPNLSALSALTSLYVNQNKLFGPPPVVPSSLNENGCTLQGSLTETNCFDCPPSGMLGRLQVHSEYGMCISADDNIDRELCADGTRFRHDDGDVSRPLRRPRLWRAAQRARFRRRLQLSRVI